MENEQQMQLYFHNHMPVVIEGFPPQPLSESHLRSTSFQLNSQNETMLGLPALSSLHEQPFKDIHSDKSVSYDGLFNRSNLNYQELCSGGTSLASGSLSTFLASRNEFNNRSNNSVVPLQQEVPSESLRAMYQGSCSYASSSSVPTSLNCDYDSFASDLNNKWNQNTFVLEPEWNWRTSTSGLEPIPFREAQDANEWISPNSANVCSSYPYGTSRTYNELSLSLATCSPSLPCPASIQNHCSDTSPSNFIHKSQSQTRLGLERSNHRNKDLSLGCASTSKSAQFSDMMPESRYRAVLQQILSDIASFSLDGLEERGGNLGSSSSKLPFSSNHFINPGLSLRDANDFSDDCGSYEPPAGSLHPKQELESKKSQLLTLLQMVDDRYNRCVDEIHTVVSAFHAATELDPQLHACFALQTTSFFYKSLRERISNQILALGMDRGSPEDPGKSLEKSFLQKQWALQQLKRKEQQLWRPQRGLPDKSVAVLRAWMFDNFLHPYPKDAEKHLLAIKSGLTRSQVSNWFINARVRLWKPMVEEMCTELNRRKGSRQDDEGSNSGNNGRSQLSIYDFNPRFNS